MRSSLWLQLRLINLKYKICESIFNNNILMSMLIDTQHDFPAVSMSTAAKPQSPSSMSTPEWPLCPHGLLPLIFWLLRKILLGQQFLIIHVLTVRKVPSRKYAPTWGAGKDYELSIKIFWMCSLFFRSCLKHPASASLWGTQPFLLLVQQSTKVQQQRWNHYKRWNTFIWMFSYHMYLKYSFTHFFLNAWPFNSSFRS